MDIRSSDLKRFLKAAGHIKGSGILPIHNYLKFEPGKITKIVTGAFLEFPCNGIDEPVLVDEKMLSNLLNITNSPIISISKNKSKVTISDGRDKPFFPIQNEKEFSDTPTPEGKKQLISSEFLEGLGMAAEVAKNMEAIPHYLMYVLVGNKSICGGDGFMAIHYPIEESVQIMLEKKVAQFLSREQVYAFALSDNHYFFYVDDGVVFGFSRQSVGYTDLASVILGEGKKITFSATASDISSFNSYAMLSSKDCYVTMDDKKMYWSDDNVGIGNDREMDNLTLQNCSTYVPAKMNAIISALGCKELDFYDGKGLFYIKSQETKASAIVAKIIKL